MQITRFAQIDKLSAEPVALAFSAAPDRTMNPLRVGAAEDFILPHALPVQVESPWNVIIRTGSQPQIT